MRGSGPERTRAPAGQAAIALFLGALFVAAMRTPLLYYQNQNTKFLHGLASAFPDRLGADWTAGTADGLPVFSALVRGVASHGDPALFYVVEALLLAVMFLSLLAVARHAGRDTGGAVFLFGAGAFLVVMAHPLQHDALRGVAGQYMTRGYLQPSEFGVFYLPALLLAQRGRAVALPMAALPAVFHPAYIAISGVLLAVIVIHRWREGLGLAPVALAVAVTAVVLPPIDLALRFAPTDQQSFARANEILAFERIPHHSDPYLWMGWVPLRKALIALVAIAVLPAGVLRSALAALLAFAVGGTVFVIATGNAEVALMAPWRASIVVVPVSVAVVSGAALGWFLRRFPGRLPQRVLAGGLAVAALWAAGDGLALKWRDWTTRTPPSHVVFARDNYAPGNVYLTSPEDYDFRLEVMAAQFVTWKTHPYLDTEVLEWRRRAGLAEQVFSEGDGTPQAGPIDCAALAEVSATYPVTHLLVTQLETRPPVVCEGLDLLHRSDGAAIYRIER